MQALIQASENESDVSESDGFQGNKTKKNPRILRNVPTIFSKERKIEWNLQPHQQSCCFHAATVNPSCIFLKSNRK